MGTTRNMVDLAELRRQAEPLRQAAARLTPEQKARAFDLDTLEQSPMGTDKRRVVAYLPPELVARLDRMAETMSATTPGDVSRGSLIEWFVSKGLASEEKARKMPHTVDQSAIDAVMAPKGVGRPAKGAEPK